MLADFIFTTLLLVFVLAFVALFVGIAFFVWLEVTRMYKNRNEKDWWKQL